MQDFPFDATITLLVFLIGVPTLVSQTIPDEVRHAVTKRSLNLQRETLVCVVVALLVICGSIGLSVYLGFQGQSQISFIWAGMVLILFGIVIVISLRAVQFYGRRDAIVLALKRETLRDLSRGRLVEDSLAELIDLGVQSAPGPDKEVVLQALQDIVDQLCARPAYVGDRLETLVQGLVDMLTAGPTPWSPQNFGKAAYILQRIIIAFNVADVNDGHFRDVDLMSAVRALSKLGQSALTMNNEAISMSFMQALAATGNRHQHVTTTVSQALYEVGIAALDKQEMLVATAALDKLSTLVAARAPAEGELVADTLGLLAHFWAAGDTAQGYAVRQLTELSHLIQSELPAALKAAQEHSAQRMRFQTADHLGQLIHDLGIPPYQLLWTTRWLAADAI